MPFVTERWPGGMLTNFATIRKAVKKMNALDRLMHDKEFASISKRERLQVQRERAKLDKNLGSIADLTRLPSALFIVDINKEHIAVAEARRLNIPTFAIVDTNCNPDLVDFPIPANDDASKSISVILKSMVDAIQEGINERKLDKEVQDDERDADDDVLVNDDENLDNADAPKARRPRKMSDDGDDKPRRPRKSAVKKN